LVKTGAALGAANGLGASESDSVGGMALDTALGGALGAGSGALGKGIEKGAGWVLKKARGAAQKTISKAVLDSTEQQAAKLAEAHRSAIGKHRSSIQSASRDLEVLEREAATGTGEAADNARAFLRTPEAQALKEQVLTSKLGTAPERISEMEALKSAAQAAKPTDEMLEAAVASDLADPAAKHVAPRLRTLAARSLPGAMGLGGAALGEPELGATAAGLTAITYGRPGTIFRNAIAKPGVRKLAGEMALKVLRKAGDAVPKASRLPLAVRALQPNAERLRPALAEDEDDDDAKRLARRK
jgi:hypothetical protein